MHKFLWIVTRETFNTLVPFDELEVFVADIKNSGQTFDQCIGELSLPDFLFLYLLECCYVAAFRDNIDKLIVLVKNWFQRKIDYLRIAFGIFEIELFTNKLAVSGIMDCLLYLLIQRRTFWP